MSPARSWRLSRSSTRYWRRAPCRCTIGRPLTSRQWPLSCLCWSISQWVCVCAPIPASHTRLWFPAWWSKYALNSRFWAIVLIYCRLCWRKLRGRASRRKTWEFAKDWSSAIWYSIIFTYTSEYLPKIKALKIQFRNCYALYDVSLRENLRKTSGIYFYLSHVRLYTRAFM